MNKLILLSLGLLLSTSLFSQQTLSLSDAVRIGLERNYDIQIEQGNVDVATNNNTWGEAGRWPSLRLDVSNNNNLTDNVKVAFPTATQGQILTNSLNPGATLNWTIFNGFNVKMTKRRLEQLESESMGNASVVINNTLQAIILGYYLCVLEDQRLEEFRKQLELSRDRFNYIQVKSEMGGAVSSDVLLEEGNYLTDSLNYINQHLIYRNALRSLNVLLAEPDPDKTYSFTNELTVPQQTYKLADLRSKMLGGNVDLQKQYITQAILGTATELSKSSKLPNLSASIGFNENRNSLDLSNAIFFTGSGFSSGPDARLNSVTDTYFVNFTLSYTLFDGGRINRAIQNAVTNEKVGELRVDKLENSLTRDLSQALDRYNIRQQLYGINDRREEAAEINLQISEDKFKNGSINSFDYRTVQNNYLSAAIVKLQAAYNLIETNVELLRLTGGLVQEYQ